MLAVGPGRDITQGYAFFMARPVDPDTPQQQPPPLAPAADLLPELQARIELATRNMTILERRIAAWESELAEVKAELREQIVPTEQPDAARLSDLEARIARLERRNLRQHAQQLAADAAALAASRPEAPPAEAAVDEDARAIVFARWGSNEANPGDVIRLSAMIDGFEPTEEVQFRIMGLDGSAPCDPIVVPAGERDTVQTSWVAPKIGRSRSREYYFEATGGGLVARSPVLTVSKG